MLFRQRFLDGIRKGTITLAFRRWKRPSAKSGGTLLTAVGQLHIASVVETTLAQISESDARRAGYESRDELLGELRKFKEGRFYRIELGALRPDPRIALRRTEVSNDAEHLKIQERLRRLDAHSTEGPWTARALELIWLHPGVRAANLARMAGQETLRFKVNIRKLKSMGLTESLEIGYRLSPRGSAFFRHRAKE